MVDVVLAPTPAGVDDAAWRAACAAVREYCGWHVAPSVTETITLDGAGGDTAFLPTLRLTNVDSITSDGALVTDPEWSEAGMVRGAGVWSRRFRGIVAQVTHGYPVCPEAIVTVIGEMVASVGTVGVASVTNHDHQVQFDASSLDRRQRAVLDRYRLAWVS